MTDIGAATAPTSGLPEAGDRQAWKHGSWRSTAPETPEEHKRRGDAASALWREMVRRVASKDREEQAS
jgi:hypothetical protein